jgi:broad specificity phosphatase PhoE
VWTSTLQRTHATAAPLKRKYMQWRALDEIDAGVCEGMTYEEIEAGSPCPSSSPQHPRAEPAPGREAKYPGIGEERKADILRWRYPRGESYLDMIGRLEPIFIGLVPSLLVLLCVDIHGAHLRRLGPLLTVWIATGTLTLPLTLTLNSGAAAVPGASRGASCGAAGDCVLLW